MYVLSKQPDRTFLSWSIFCIFQKNLKQSPVHRHLSCLLIDWWVNEGLSFLALHKISFRIKLNELKLEFIAMFFV